MKVFKAVLAKVNGTIAFAVVMLIVSIILAYLLPGDTGQLGYVLAAVTGVVMAHTTQDMLHLYDRPYKFNRAATYASPLLLFSAMGMIFLNVSLDIPVYAVVLISLLVGYQVGWFSIIYNSFLRSMQTNTNVTVLDVMKDAQEILQTRGEHSEFCAIHPTGLVVKQDLYCSCGLEHSIKQLREAIRVVSKP